MTFVDAAAAVRSGEGIDVEVLAAYLARHVPEIGPPFSLEQFPSGHSNLTYLLHGHASDGAPRALVLRRPPHGNVVKTAHDMGREVKILSKLAAAWDKAPRPVHYCEDASVIGAPFYLVERVQGVILRRKLPKGMTLSAEKARDLGDLLARTLAELHALSIDAVGLADLGKPEGYVTRQVEGWAKRYEAAKTDDIQEVDAVVTWLRQNLPVSPAPTLIHNDFKFDNVVLREDDLGAVVGVLDWEMSTIGDPLMDLGTAIAYWVEATDPEPLKQFAFGPTFVPGSLSRAEFAAAYARHSGRAVGGLLFYYVFALFKNAVVAQQIYARYKKGLTQDERFAMMIVGVNLLARAATEAIASEKISNA